MYQPKDHSQKIIGTLKLLSEKSETEILRVLSVYHTSLEEIGYSLGTIKEVIN